MWDYEAERELWADICRESFWWFLLECIRLPEFPEARKWFQPYIYKPMSDWFEMHVREWEQERLGEFPMTRYLAALIPREFGKTTAFTKFGQIWLHVRNPDLSTYTGSEDIEQAIRFLSTIRHTISGAPGPSWFTWLYGNWKATDREWLKESVVHAARRNMSRGEPSFGTWGVLTGLTSTHPDALFFDDPISYEQMSKHSRWLDIVNSHVASLGSVQKADSLVVWPGTRYDDGDHFGRAFDKQGIASISGMPLPYGSVRPDGVWHVFYMQSRDTRDVSEAHPKGRPTFPHQWPEWRLRQREEEDALKYAAQQMNDPASSAFNPLTQEQIAKCAIDASLVPHNVLRYSIHCDTAFKYLERQARGDESVIEVWGHHLGTGMVYFIEGYGSHSWRSQDFNRMLVMLIQRYHTQKKTIFAITDERETGGKEGTWVRTLIKDCHEAGLICPPVFLQTRAGRKKEERMSAAANYWVRGFVKYIDGAPGAERLTDQMKRLASPGAPNDWADAGADVFCNDVYVPMRRVGALDEQPVLVRPYDSELQDGRIGATERPESWDDWNAEDDWHTPI